jgi:methionyl-tRNA synthetase
MAQRAEAYLRCPLTWDTLSQPLLDHDLGEFKPLIQRIDPKAVARMVESNQPPQGADAGTAQEHGAAAKKDSGSRKKGSDAGQHGDDVIDIRDFHKVDLRVARIEAAEAVEGADRLLALTLDVGPLGRRTVFSGIRAAYDPATLVGRHTVLVANLAPRKMRFGVSEGMVLAAGEGDGDVYLLAPDSGATPGMKIT